MLFYSQGNAQCNNPPSYNDPASQDGILELMNIPCAWTITNGNPAITVAVFDKYLDNAHSDLVEKVVEINGFCNPENADIHHGIQCFGAVAGIRNNGICIAGSGGETTVAGWCSGASNTTVLEAMNKGYKIISISAWGWLTKQTMETLTNNGVTVLIAGLNQYHQASNPNGYHSVPGVIHVGRAHQNGSFWPYLSGHPGPNLNMDVLVVSDGLYRIADGNLCEQAGGGTSIGTPLLAGVVALMKDVNPCLFPGDIEEILVQTAAPVNNPATRAGVINAYAAVQMAQNFQGFDITWSGNQSIDYDQVSGDLTISSGASITLVERLKTGSNSKIIIETGAKLTVLGRIEMGENARIVVKRGGELIVDGGTVTTGDCANQWKGIIINGNSAQEQQIHGNSLVSYKNGVVYLNNATIENANICVDMSASNITWPQTPHYYGGHVTAINTIFTNTTSFSNYRRVAAFYQYTKTEKSKFINCSINNVSVGMTHWGIDGTIYEQCNFDNYKQNALLTYDSKINVVNGNTFDNGNHDQFNQSAIDLYQTYAIPNGSIIGNTDSAPNHFYGGYHSIFSDGEQPINHIEVVSNIFNGGKYSIRFDGTSNHTIRLNEMNNVEFGATFVANGSHYNTLFDNQFSYNGVGVFCYYNNEKFDFLSNCFDNTTSKDVRIHGGPISSHIGNSSIAASNILSVDSTRRISSTGSVPLINYHILIGTSNSERTVPVNQSNLNKIFNAQNIDVGTCASSSSRKIDESKEDVLPESISDLKRLIQELSIKLVSLEREQIRYDTNSAQWLQLDSEILGVKKSLQNANVKLIEFEGKNKAYQELVKRFENDKFLYKTYIYGIMLANQDYKEANGYLNSIKSTSKEEADFIVVQDINLKRFFNHRYVPSKDDLSSLYKIGYKTDPMSGYARALYRFFTNKKIELPLPKIDDEDINGRSNDEENKPFFTLSPNPTIGLANLEFMLNRDAHIAIFDQLGKSVWEKELSKDETRCIINLSTHSNGVYYIIIRDNNTQESLYSNKLFLLK